MRITIAFVGLALIACGKSKDKAAPTPELEKPDKPVPKIDGPSITPTVTSSITFVTPKDPNTTWFEVAFPCYRAAIELQPGNKASDAFTQVSPLIAPALAAADIDLDKDVAAIGGWSCGEGPCIYMALTLRHPDKITDMLKTIPGVEPKTVAPNHWSFEAPGAQGMREIHIRALPIQWGAALPKDDWSQDEAKATHVLFISGLMGKGDVDPLTVLADAKTAPDRVKDAEGLLKDARERCGVGIVGPNDFKPGFKLTRARFAMSVPSNGGDPLTKLIGSSRTLDTELEMTIDPAPSEKDYQQWYDEAAAWIGETVEPIKAQFAGGGPMVDAYLDMFKLVGTRGFDHALKGKSLTLSWRTDRIQESDLSAIEAELEHAAGSTP
ncbi:MAG TPA: hypothetical protein VL463_25990 [Kofleriaceae bacterium]|jgi:hypothetical protein|nr:hypothetical protein [Kofleriaceae bacterium]